MAQLKVRPGNLAGSLADELINADNKGIQRSGMDSLSVINKRLGFETERTLGCQSVFTSAVNSLVRLSENLKYPSIADDALNLLGRLASAVKEEVRGSSRYLRIERGPIEFTGRNGRALTVKEFLDKHQDLLHTQTNNMMTPADRTETDNDFRKFISAVAPSRLPAAEKLISNN